MQLVNGNFDVMAILGAMVALHIVINTIHNWVKETGSALKKNY